MRAKLLTTTALATGALAWASAANATLTITVTDNGVAIAGCSAGPGAASPQSLACSEAGVFTSISITVQGAPTVPSPDLGTITISATEAAGLTAAHTLLFDVVQNLPGPFAGGTGSTTFTYNGLIGSPGPVTYNQFFNGGAAIQTTMLGPSATPLTFGPAFNPLAPIAGAFTDEQEISAVFPISASEQELEADAQFQVISSTPEPASLTLLGSALLGLGWAARRRRKNKNL